MKGFAGHWLRPVFAAGILLATVLTPHRVAAQGNPDPFGFKFNSGQSIQPIFEGWARNPDGTFSMYFGYLNRNYAETPIVPVGPDNKFEPGDPDRGQPTFFDTRIHHNRSCLCGKNAKCRIAQEQGALNDTGCAVGGHLTQHVNIGRFRPGRWPSDTEEGATHAGDRAGDPTNSQTPAGPTGGASQRPDSWQRPGGRRSGRSGTTGTPCELASLARACGGHV